MGIGLEQVQIVNLRLERRSFKQPGILPPRRSPAEAPHARGTATVIRYGVGDARLCPVWSAWPAAFEPAVLRWPAARWARTARTRRWPAGPVPAEDPLTPVNRADNW